MRPLVTDPEAPISGVTDCNSGASLVGSQSDDIAPFIQIGDASKPLLAILEQRFRAGAKSVGQSHD